MDEDIDRLLSLIDVYMSASELSDTLHVLRTSLKEVSDRLAGINDRRDQRNLLTMSSIKRVFQNGFVNESVSSSCGTWKSIMYTRDPVQVLREQVSLWDGTQVEQEFSFYSIKTEVVNNIRQHVRGRVTISSDKGFNDNRKYTN